MAHSNNECLWDKLVPQAQWEVIGTAAETGDEVVFEGANGTLGCVATMDIRWDVLVVDAVGVQEVREGRTSFVVEGYQFGTLAGFAEDFDCSFVSCNHFGTRAIFHCFDVDVVGILVIKD